MCRVIWGGKKKYLIYEEGEPSLLELLQGAKKEFGEESLADLKVVGLTVAVTTIKEKEGR